VTTTDHATEIWVAIGEMACARAFSSKNLLTGSSVIPVIK